MSRYDCHPNLSFLKIGSICLLSLLALVTPSALVAQGNAAEIKSKMHLLAGNFTCVDANGYSPIALDCLDFAVRQQAGRT